MARLAGPLVPARVGQTTLVEKGERRPGTSAAKLSEDVHVVLTDGIPATDVEGSS